MIKLVLALYLFLIPLCELMVSWLHDADFQHCNDSPMHAAACYAASDWGYGGQDIGTLRDDAALMSFVFKLPFVRTVSCWKAP
jgi:hypothetical protein